MHESVLIGEGFAGDGVNAAHVNVVAGERNGPVGTAWATALATPRPGHVPFVAVASPGVPVRPFTLFVNKATIEGDRHGELTWGAAQAGVSAGMGLAHGAGEGAALRDSFVVIAAVWVNPLADDEEAVFANNRDAMLSALRMAAGPDTVDPAQVRAMLDPSNPYFRRP